MRPLMLLVLSCTAILGLPGCKLVKTAPLAAEGGSDAAADPITTLAAETFASKLVPLIDQTAQPVVDLRRAIVVDIDAAGAAYGNRGAGSGAAWNFAVKGTGIVIAANLTSRARKAEVDTDADGTADMTLLLGPVITGTSLRDVAPFFDFGDFRDQIEFAQLGRALNDLASAGLVLPQGDIVGKTLSFTGAVPLKSASAPWVITATLVTVQP